MCAIMVNATMLFTWNVELVLLGLVGLSLAGVSRDVFLASMLTLGGVLGGIAHLVCLSLDLETGHQEISTAVLAWNTGLVISALVAPSSASSPVTQAAVAAIACLVLLVTLGMLFAARRGPTLLILHHSVLTGVLWGIFLFSCPGFWHVVVLGALAVGMAVLYALRLTSAALGANIMLSFESLVVGVVQGGVSAALLVAEGVVLVCLLLWMAVAAIDKKALGDGGTPPADGKGGYTDGTITERKSDESANLHLPSAPPMVPGLASEVFHFRDLNPSLRWTPLAREKFH